jgi:choline kinase
MSNTPSVVIPAAGLGHRMKSYGPKALIECANKEPLICRQIRMLRRRFTNPQIVVVLGFGADRIRKVLPTGVQAITNDEYQVTNVAYSIRLGMVHCVPWLPLLIVYGDLVFNDPVLEAIDLKKSSIVLDKAPRGREQEVGVTVVGGQVTAFSHGLSTKWAQLATLQYHEQSLFVDVMCEPHRRKQFGYEVFNEVLERGGVFEASDCAGMKLVEVDTSKDILRAKDVK